MWTDALGGANVSYADYVDNGKSYKNYIMTCRVHGPGCSKTKGVYPASVRAHGELEPLAFLEAWQDVPWPTVGGKAPHALENPSAEAVAAVFAAKEEALREVFVRVHG